MDNHPDDPPVGRLREAMRRQMLVWKKIGLDGTMGEIKGFQNILPSAQTQSRLKGPPTKSKFLAVSYSH